MHIDGFSKKEGRARPAKYCHTEKIKDLKTFSMRKTCRYCGDEIIWLKKQFAIWAANIDGKSHKETCKVLSKKEDVIK